MHRVYVEAIPRSVTIPFASISGFRDDQYCNKRSSKMQPSIIKLTHLSGMPDYIREIFNHVLQVSVLYGKVHCHGSDATADVHDDATRGKFCPFEAYNGAISEAEEMIFAKYQPPAARSIGAYPVRERMAVWNLRERNSFSGCCNHVWKLTSIPNARCTGL